MRAMIVCICKAVSDRHIRAAVENGASRVQEISRLTGLGTCCGKCLPEAKAAVAHCLGRQREVSRQREVPCFTAAEAAA